MGMVYTEITLKNIMDEGFAKGGFIKPEDIRTAKVTAVADTGSMNLVITEKLCQELGLEIREEKIARIANRRRRKIALSACCIFQRHRNPRQPEFSLPC